MRLGANQSKQACTGAKSGTNQSDGVKQATALHTHMLYDAVLYANACWLHKHQRNDTMNACGQRLQKHLTLQQGCYDNATLCRSMWREACCH